MLFNDALQFLNLLGVPSEFIEESADGTWLRCSCPLALKTHSKGTDNNPSFGLSLSEGVSGYKCFTCGEGNVYDLLHRYGWLIRQRPDLSDFLALHEGVQNDDDEAEVIDPYQFNPVHVTEDRPVPAAIVEHFPRISDGGDTYEFQRCQDWLIDRGIRHDLWDKYNIRYFPDEHLIIFPLEYEGEVWALHARSRLKKQFFYMTPRMVGLMYDKPWGRKDLWFGMDGYVKGKPVILVESETDKLRLESLDDSLNVLASCGPLGKPKLSKIQSPTWYLGFDSDDPGVAYCKKAINYAHASSQLFRLSWATVGANDAGDLKAAAEWDRVFDARLRVEVLKGGGLQISPVNEIDPTTDRYQSVSKQN